MSNEESRPVENELDLFVRGYDRAVQAIRDRAPLTDAEKAAGWVEDPLGSGLRANEITGEVDDSHFVSHPPLYAEYRANLIAASRREKDERSE